MHRVTNILLFLLRSATRATSPRSASPLFKPSATTSHSDRLSLMHNAFIRRMVLVSSSLTADTTSEPSSPSLPIAAAARAKVDALALERGSFKLTSWEM